MCWPSTLIREEIIKKKKGYPQWKLWLRKFSYSINHFAPEDTGHTVTVTLPVCYFLPLICEELICDFNHSQSGVINQQ